MKIKKKSKLKNTQTGSRPEHTEDHRGQEEEKELVNKRSVSECRQGFRNGYSVMETQVSKETAHGVKCRAQIEEVWEAAAEPGVRN